MTLPVFDQARQRLTGKGSIGEIHWLAHGEYLLQGLDDPVPIAEVGASDNAPLTAPPDAPKARRIVASGDELTLGWRPAVGLTVPGREHWILEDQAGEGGFGEVWIAAHDKTHAKRIFKFCFEAERVRGLRREVVLFRLLKEALGDRHDIAQIVDWQFDESPYFIEAEYSEGGDLAEWAEHQGGLESVPLQTRLDLAAQAAEALAAAHGVGVLHKDIKPSNILIRGSAEEPRIQLTDFGIGTVTDAALLDQGVTRAGLTQTLLSSSSSSAGTPLFMAPEVIEGKAATTQSDLYSLGVVLYQLVTGNFQRAVAPGWRRDIEDELLREDIAACVEGRPEHRLSSALELAQRLRSLEQKAATTCRRAAEPGDRGGGGATEALVRVGDGDRAHLYCGRRARGTARESARPATGGAP